MGMLGFCLHNQKPIIVAKQKLYNSNVLSETSQKEVEFNMFTNYPPESITKMTREALTTSLQLEKLACCPNPLSHFQSTELGR